MLRYTKSHYLHQLNATPNYDHLGHPINAYHLIRHVASGWNKIVKNKVEINRWVFKNSKKEHWRSFPGYIGILLATYFLVRLHSFGSTKKGSFLILPKRHFLPR